WLIDDLSITHRSEDLFPINSGVGNSLNEQGTSLANWITEGNWGLAPEYFSDLGGGSNALGQNWTAYWFDCKQTPDNQGSPRNCIGPVEHGVRLDSIVNSTDPGIGTSNVSMDDLPSTVLPNIGLDFGDAVSQPPGASGTTWNNDFMARFVKVVTLATGTYSLTTVTDDGARVMIEQWDPTGNGGFGAATSLGANGTCTNGGTWNIINDWVNQTAAQGINIGTCDITVAGDYRLTFEYYEDSGTASVVLNAGSDSFSFADSPWPGASSTSRDGSGHELAYTSTPRSSSSLTLDGLLDLSSASNPILDFYTLYDLHNANTIQVERSIDGGFTWNTTDLVDVTGSMPISGISQYIDNTNWEHHQISMNGLVGEQVALRFRLSTSAADNTYGGWWLDNIQVTSS
ncbi:MAG: hypothetical protein H7175_25535, partial [Burkholderiales bacterium]|nr:hypothetical protein [Anaerolineae bacterium]